MKSARAVLAALALALVAIWAIAFVAATSFPDFDGRRTYVLFDDAMVAMRYAWNLAHGKGLVWNEGERVEGYTSLPMTLLMAAPAALLDRRAAVATVQGIGVVTLLAAAMLAARLGRSLRACESGRPGVLEQTIALLGTALYFPLAYWTLMGMETGLLVCLLLGAIAVAVRPSFGVRSQELALAGALLGLAQLARPDAAVPAAVVLVLSTLRWVRVDGFREAASRAAKLVLFAMALPALQLVFRVVYYGEIVPNTYVLKIAGVPLDWRMELGARHLLAYFAESWPLVAASAIAVARRPTAGRTMALSTGASLIVYQLWSGGDAWPYFRLLAPATVLFWVLAVDAAFGWAAEVSHRPASRRLVAAASCVAMLVFADARFVDEMTFRAVPYQVEFNRHNALSAQVLTEILDENATIGVLWAGTIPYYTGRRAVDFLGKSDPSIARRAPTLEGTAGALPGHNKYDLADSIGKRRPTYVQQFAWGTDDLRDWAAAHYCPVWHRGWRTDLLRGASAVRWAAIREVPDRVQRSEPLARCASSPSGEDGASAESAFLPRDH